MIFITVKLNNKMKILYLTLNILVHIQNITKYKIVIMFITWLSSITEFNVAFMEFSAIHPSRHLPDGLRAS